MTTNDALLDLLGARDNFVFLQGRLADAPLDRELPSGDVMTTFRLTVARPAGARVPVDSLECVTVRPKIRRALARADAGTQLQITGSLQRRFWRGPAGPASRYAVDVETVQLVRAGRPAAASPARKRASA